MLRQFMALWYLKFYKFKGISKILKFEYLKNKKELLKWNEKYCSYFQKDSKNKIVKIYQTRPLNITKNRTRKVRYLNLSIKKEGKKETN